MGDPKNNDFDEKITIGSSSISMDHGFPSYITVN